ncbi:MAG: IPT/TIG domain-containing protein [Ignavibacteriales bacterium]|nr:IPT/TIG domain-containing protein [Ignavibacteriales bacterium]
MKKIIYKTFISLFLLSIVFINGCADDPTASLDGYPSANLPSPVLSTLEPSAQALAGITEITITGTNFSADARNNLVYFNGVPGTILSATPTELTVKVPNVVADTVMVKIAVVGAQDFSNQFQYKMVAAWEEYYTSFDPIADKAYAFVFNNAGDMLVSIENAGIKKINPQKVLSDYIPKGNAQFWNCLKFGPNNELYGSRTINAIWKLAEAIAPASPWVALPAGVFAKDVEFDQLSNMWVVGAANKILRIDQNKVVTTYTVTGTYKSARVFNNSLYVAGNNGTTEGVWKIPILSNSDLDVANQELYFDLLQSYTGITAIAITFAADGDLIIGTDQDPDPLIVVHPDKSSEVLYPGVIKAGKVLFLNWTSTSNSLYFTRDLKKDTAGKIVFSQTVIRVEMQKPGAPYFGN